MLMIKDELAPAIPRFRSIAVAEDANLLTDDDFSMFYRQYFDQVYRYLFNRLGNQQDAEDVCSQTFIQAYKSFASLRDPSRFPSWVFKISRNKLNDFWRRKKPVVALDDELGSGSPDLLHSTEQAERHQRLAHLIRDLPEKDQEIIRLRYLGELNFREISLILGKSEGATKKSLYRLLAQLQSQME